MISEFLHKRLKFLFVNFAGAYFLFDAITESLLLSSIANVIPFGKQTSTNFSYVTSTFLCGFVGWHCLLWQIIFGNESSFRQVFLKSIDYFWYIGAFLSLIVSVQSFDFSNQQKNAETLRGNLNSIEGEFIEKLDETAKACASGSVLRPFYELTLSTGSNDEDVTGQFNPQPICEAISVSRSAHNVDVWEILIVCPEWSWALSKDYLFMNLVGDLDEAEKRIIKASATLCFNAQDWKTASRDLNDSLDRMDAQGETPIQEGVELFRYIVLLICFRITKTSAEIFDSFRVRRQGSRSKRA